MSVIVDQRPITTAIEAALAAATGKPGAVGRAPVNATPPYWVLTPDDGNEFIGPPSVPESDARLIYQVRSVGARGDQVAWMADKVRRTILERAPGGGWVTPIDIAGLVVIDRSYGGAGGMDTEGDIANIVDLFEIVVTPA